MPKELSGRTLLVADDDQDNAELLTLVVEGAGARVRMVTSAAAALEVVSAPWGPDALLLDIGLPDLDGYALLREIRKVPGLSRVPAVAVSGYTSAGHKKRAAEAGFAVHVSKPYDPEAVVHLVAKLTSPTPGGPVAQAFREVLGDAGLHAALAFLNKRTAHRFTAVYRFDGDTLRNVALFDCEHPATLRGDDHRLGETYCAIVRRERMPFVTANATIDARLVEHPARLRLQSYCGVLLRNADSTPFGSLCHFDPIPVDPTDEVLELLEGAAPLIAALVAG